MVARNPAEAHLQQEATASHLEVEMLAALALQSSQEYHQLLLSYVRHLASTGTQLAIVMTAHVMQLSAFTLLNVLFVSIGNEVKLRAVCTQLLTHKLVRGNQPTAVVAVSHLFFCV